MAPRGDIGYFDPGRITSSVDIPVGGWGVELFDKLDEYCNLEPEDYGDFESKARLARSTARILVERWDLASGKDGYEGAINRGATYIQLSLTTKERNFLKAIATEIKNPEAIAEMSQVQAKGWY